MKKFVAFDGHSPSYIKRLYRHLKLERKPNGHFTSESDTKLFELARQSADARKIATFLRGHAFKVRKLAKQRQEELEAAKCPTVCRGFGLFNSDYQPPKPKQKRKSPPPATQTRLPGFLPDLKRRTIEDALESLFDEID